MHICAIIVNLIVAVSRRGLPFCDRPARNVLTINLKTAKALDLDVPWFLQQRADEVIERISFVRANAAPARSKWHIAAQGWRCLMSAAGESGQWAGNAGYDPRADLGRIEIPHRSEPD